MEGEEDGVSWDKEALAGHEGDVGVGVGEEGEGGGEMSCMAARHHPTDDHWRRKVKVKFYEEDNRLLQNPSIPIQLVKAPYSH